MHFKIGDRVIYKNDISNIATIVQRHGPYEVLLKFDKYDPSRHNGGGVGERG